MSSVWELVGQEAGWTYLIPRVQHQDGLEVTTKSAYGGHEGTVGGHDGDMDGQVDGRVNEPVDR